MITSQALSHALDLSNRETIPAKILGYFRARQRNRVHEEILNAFIEAQKVHDITKADVARRMGKGSELITRWLGGPGNLTLDTISDLMLAVGKEIEFRASDIHPATRRNDEPIVVVKGKALREAEQKKLTGSAGTFTVEAPRFALSAEPQLVDATTKPNKTVELSPAQ